MFTKVYHVMILYTLSYKRVFIVYLLSGSTEDNIKKGQETEDDTDTDATEVEPDTQTQVFV